MPTITIHPGGETFNCAPGDTILRAALRAGHGMPYSCNTGSCGNCLFELIEGTVTHQRADPPAWSEKKHAKRNRWLGCQAEPRGDCTVKFRADPDAVPDDTPRIRSATLEAATPITRDITNFALRVTGADGFRPGQYALLTPPGVEGGRAYSMSNLSGGQVWDFMIKKVPDGAATGALFDRMTLGDTLTLDGPFGTAYLREDIDRDIVLMAGGSGLSPMVSIARGAEAAGMLKTRKLHFFYGARAEADLFDPADVLGDLADKVAFTAALSEPGPDWSGPTGFLHDVVAEKMGDTLPAHEIYFAGPAVMAQAIQQMAHGKDVPMDQLHFDEFY